MPRFDLGVEARLQCGLEFAALDGALHVVPVRTGAEAPEPTPISGDQSFFALRVRRTWKTSWITLLPFRGDKAIISDAAATMIQVIGEARISSMCMMSG